MVIGWIIFSICAVMTIIMLSGKGSFLVAGFNTMDKQEKAKYNSTKVSRNAGFALVIVDIALLALLIITKLFLSGKISEKLFSYGIGIFIVCILAVAVIGSIQGFKKAKK